MGTILASAIITKIRTVLQDLATVKRNSDAEILAWLSSGQREAAIIKPDIYVVTGNVQMVAGTKQSVPAGGLLINIIRNKGSAGTTAGAAIGAMTQAIMDDMIPGWHSDTANGVAQFYVYDDRNPGTFYLYPPQPTSSPHYIELDYSATPADIATVATAITIPDCYENALIDYGLYRCLSKETEYLANGLADKYYASFARSIAGKQIVEAEAKIKDASNAVQA